MPGERGAILVVEDDDGNRELLSGLLEWEGYSVQTAATGFGGLARIAAGGIDLVVLDRKLPDMDGEELCEQVRQRESHGHLPIIMVTAVARDPRYDDGSADCADEYVAKPFDVDELLDRVRTYLPEQGGEQRSASGR